jgi:hypothetical protein
MCGRVGREGVRREYGVHGVPEEYLRMCGGVRYTQWLPEHQAAFEAIKMLVISRECLTTIDHVNPGDNKIFVTCDASDWRTGATLSFRPTWETSRPVVFDSLQLKGAQKNYPVHEKELLSIVRALKKWRSDLLGGHFFIYTDHRTLENFNTQKDLSRRQLCWQEYLSQYKMSITYIKGEDNTVADALSRIPPNSFPDEEEFSIAGRWSNAVTSILRIEANSATLKAIKKGYQSDKFCIKIKENAGFIPSLTESNGLLYIGSRLVIPRVNDVRKNLFRLAHNVLGHFGSDKSYALLRNDYYWPNMRRDLEKAYIPSCEDCQRNKSSTRKPRGPLHPLPVPECRGDSVAIDFIGPLPVDEGYDCIVTFTDRIGADIQLIQKRTTLTAPELAILFFNHWYCENGLPVEIISDQNKLFTSKFWEALHTITGVKLKMSTLYHPQTDGTSERTNKTVVQSICYHVERNQKGWVKSLPRIRFGMMNTVNTSTGFSGFQLKLGRSLRVIPLIVPDRLPETTRESTEAFDMIKLIETVENDVAEAKDNLLQSKALQAVNTNRHHGREDKYDIDDKVMLSTMHRRGEYKRKGQDRVAKFFPRFDGPYEVIDAFPEKSNYTLNIPSSKLFNMFHASELKRYHENDATLFPS